MIKNIVFDVGDVLVDFCYKKFMRNLGFDEETVEFLSDNMVVTGESEQKRMQERNLQRNSLSIKMRY